jgi:UDP:flavonoid glycosyltransferase YjiC (YdhE family)
MSAAPERLACFVSPHGLGHAARTAAILTALQRRLPDLGADLFTLAPADFFHASGCRNLTVHRESTDIGFVQKSALVEDIPETARCLDAFLPFRADLIDRLAATVRHSGCRAVMCDIAPLGIAVARAARLPSILVENFTWDDLYAHYAARDPRMLVHAHAMRRHFDAADIHIQTEPVCHPSARADFTSHPVGRAPRTGRAAMRRQLGLVPGRKMVLVTMGGVSERTPMLAHMADRQDLLFVVAWGAARQQVAGNVMSLPLQSDFYHPDLVNAADAVIGKLGYSTLAEVLRAGIPFGYVSRQNYPEMPALIACVEANLPCLQIQHADLNDESDPDLIDRLLNQPHRSPGPVDGAEQIADFLQGRL